MSCPPGLDSLGTRGFAKALHKPCILIAPLRTKGAWWVLNRGGSFGYVDGDLQRDVTMSMCSWMRFLCREAGREGGVDSERPRALGFSAGAYALTEILAHSAPQPFIWCLALAGLHGHGQPDLKGLERHCKRECAHEVMDKFEAYLERLRRHPGVPGGMSCLHHPEDNVCPWRYAKKIARVLDARQVQVGCSAVEVEELWDLDEVSKASAKAAKWQRENGKQEAPNMHNYQDTAFFRAPFLQRFLRTVDADSGDKHSSAQRQRSRSRPRVTLRLTARRSRSASPRQRSRGRSCSAGDGRQSRRPAVRLVARR